MRPYFLLLTLLFSFGLMANENNNQLDELNSELKKQLLIVSELGKKIAAQEDLIKSIREKASLTLYEVLEPLNDQEKKEFNDEIQGFLERMHLIIKGESKTEDFFMKELFLNTKNNYAIAQVKSPYIRLIIERQIWKDLFADYQKSLFELFAIDQKLTALQKN